jgi:hypothetical protein
MLKLYDDLIINIGEDLTDKEKITLSMVSKKLNKFKHKFIYREQIIITKINNLSFFDNFESVIMFNDGRYPKNVKYIYCKANTQTVIFPNITHLTFSNDFDQPINNCIPDSVTHLTFGQNFNQSIKGCIPNSVTHLIFGSDFDKSIAQHIPDGVTHLTFGKYFTGSIENNLPKKLKSLTLGPHFPYTEKHIPESVTDLTLIKINRYLANFCLLSSVTHLTLDVGLAFPGGSIKQIIPLSVIHLTLGGYFDHHLIPNDIHESVTHLTFGEYFNQRISNCIPRSVTHLTFGRDFNQYIKKSLPRSVTHLTFGRDFNQCIKKSLPQSVTHVTFGHCFNQSIDTIPLSVIKIILSKNYNKPIHGNIKSRIDIVRI